MIQMKKKTLEQINKFLYFLVAFAMVLQPVGAPSLLVAMAQDADLAAEEPSAPEVTKEEPAEEPEEEEEVVEKETEEAVEEESDEEAAVEEEIAEEAIEQIEESQEGGDETGGAGTEGEDGTAATDAEGKVDSGDETEAEDGAEEAVVETPVETDEATTPPAEETSGEDVAPEVPVVDEQLVEEVVAQETVVVDENAVPVPEAEEPKETWTVDGKKATTTGPVAEGVEYKFPGNEKVSIVFTSLPDNPGMLSIEEVALTDDQVAELGALSDKAYDITSTMENGTFKYDLSLPYPDKDNDGKAETLDKQEISADNVSVKFSEDGENFEDVDKDDYRIKKSAKTIEIVGLNHFTFFVPTIFYNTGQVWMTKENVAASDDLWAQAAVGLSMNSPVLRTAGYNMNIPAEAIIKGITVVVEKGQSIPNCFRDYDANLMKDGYTLLGSKPNTNVWPVTDTVVTYGGNTDLWGQTWTAAEVNDPGFGFAITAVNSGCSNSGFARVDYVAIEVAYTMDGIPPVIAFHADVNASATSAAGVNVAYTAPDATDNVDATAPAICVPASGSLFPIGTTIVTCNKTDAAGNSAIPTTFNVIVSGDQLPVVTINPGIDTIEVNSVFTDAGAAWTDNVDGAGMIAAATSGTVNTAVVGSYVLTYSYTDTNGNIGSADRTVNVVDTTLPVITLVGATPIDVIQNSVYTDAGATASDNYDGNITGSIATVNSVNTAVLGTYTVTYNVSDSSGNAATQVTRTVNVVAVPVCQTGADTDGSGSISNLEILSYINSWKTGAVSNLLILQAIQYWKVGAGC